MSEAETFSRAPNSGLYAACSRHMTASTRAVTTTARIAIGSSPLRTSSDIGRGEAVPGRRRARKDFNVAGKRTTPRDSCLELELQEVVHGANDFVAHLQEHGERQAGLLAREHGAN